MAYTVRVALFENAAKSFYPKELKEESKTKSKLNMRIKVLPEYIDKQEETIGAYEEIIELYENLKVGQKIKAGNSLRYSELINVDRFQEDYPPSKYLSRGIFAINIFKGMLPGETIKFKSREFYKNIEDGLIYVYEQLKTTIRVVEVDTRRPWTIETNDGKEYIKYLNHVVVNEIYNYYEF